MQDRIPNAAVGKFEEGVDLVDVLFEAEDRGLHAVRLLAPLEADRLHALHRRHAGLLPEPRRGVLEEEVSKNWPNFRKSEWPNFGGLVLGCIESDFCEQIFVLQHFGSREARTRCSG